MKTVLVLVEGQTEERFIKDVLAPEFYALDFFFDPRLLITKRVKHGASFKGGVTTYGKFRNDVVRLLGEAQGRTVTTVIDYYGLPGDFPGMSTRPNASPLERVLHVEKQIHEDFGAPPNLLPFLALHEFEAWLFSSRDELPNTLTQRTRRSILQPFATRSKTRNRSTKVRKLRRPNESSRCFPDIERYFTAPWPRSGSGWRRFVRNAHISMPGTARSNGLRPNREFVCTTAHSYPAFAFSIHA